MIVTFGQIGNTIRFVVDILIENTVYYFILFVDSTNSSGL